MITLGVIGDFGVVNTKSVNISKLVKSWNPDAILTTGDNLYNQKLSEKAYESVVGTLYGDYLPEKQIPSALLKKVGTNDLTLCTKKKSRIPCKTRFLPCVGNHDYPYEPYCNYFRLDTYYAVEFTKYGNLLKVISINNYLESDGAIGRNDSIQRKWLENELCKSSNFKWIIIYNHFPQLCSNNDKTENNNQRRKFPYHEYPNVVLVLSGHQHLYERLHVNKVTNVVIGTSGHSVRKVWQDDKVSESVFLDDSGYGALKLTIDSNQICGEYFVLDKVVRSADQFRRRKCEMEDICGYGTTTVKDSFVIY